MTKFSSAKYWEDRYSSDKDNRDSGAGSYGRLARFKAKSINRFVKKNSIRTVVEFGCGDGNQLRLAKYPRYVGLDVSQKAIDMCDSAFKDDPTKYFIWLDPNTKTHKLPQAELAMSLDVIFHLVEDQVFNNYMRDLFASATKYVIIYSSNAADIVGTTHVKHRIFTDWIGKNVSKDWQLIKQIDNKHPFDEQKPNDTSFANFYFYCRVKS